MVLRKDRPGDKKGSGIPALVSEKLKACSRLLLTDSDGLKMIYSVP